MRNKTTKQFLNNNFYLTLTEKVRGSFLMSSIVLLLIFSSASGYSQSNRRVNIVHKNEFLNSLRVNSSRNSSLYEDGLSLINDLKPSVYLINNELSVRGENPVRMYTDVNSLSNANRAALPIRDVEIVVINITRTSELLSPIDLSVFSGYKKLKYIYFKVSFDFEVQTLTNLIRNWNPEVVLFYSIEKLS